MDTADEDTYTQCMGLGYALSTSTIVQMLIKLFVGGLRPHFLTLCKPRGGSTAGVGPGHVWHTDEVCAGDRGKLRDAQMSFPSGHSSAAFAGFGFLALWCNARVGILGEKPRAGGEGEGGREKEKEKERRVPHWKMALGTAPLLVAVLLAGSKVRDGWHHPSDVVAGAVIGGVFAVAAYRMVFRSVWDQGTNHLARERFEGRGEGKKMGKGERADGGEVV